MIESKMDQLPCELLCRIFHYMDNWSDILCLSRVCRCWQSCTMGDEYFLNHWNVPNKCVGSGGGATNSIVKKYQCRSSINFYFQSIFNQVNVACFLELIHSHRTRLILNISSHIGIRCRCLNRPIHSHSGFSYLVNLY
jgi:hypothetical protein